MFHFKAPNQGFKTISKQPCQNEKQSLTWSESPELSQLHELLTMLSSGGGIDSSIFMGCYLISPAPGVRE